MKQVFRRVIDRRGRVLVADLPVPHMGPDQVLVQSHYSLISSGTEMGTLKKTPAELVRQTISDPGCGTWSSRRSWRPGPARPRAGYGTRWSCRGRSAAAAQVPCSRSAMSVEGLEFGSACGLCGERRRRGTAPTINHVVPVPHTVDLRHGIRHGRGHRHAVAAARGAGVRARWSRCTALAWSASFALASPGGRVCGAGIDANRRRRVGHRYWCCLGGLPGRTRLEAPDQPLHRQDGVDATAICASLDSPEIINSAMETTRRQGCVAIVGDVKLGISPQVFLHHEIDLRHS